MLQLSIQDYDGKSTLIPLTDGELTIGRDEDNSICLTERNVSRRHARIIAHNGTVSIENIQATWGTRLNNLLLRERAAIQAGDVVQIGNYVIELVGGEARRDTALVQEDAPRAAPAAGGSERPPDSKTAIVSLDAIQEGLQTSPSDVTGIPAAEQPRLVVESENLRGLELRITKSPTVVGRVPEMADLVIDHRSISKEHARLTQRPDGSWEVLDLGSANGIQVNGEPYSKSDVHSGDVLVFGHVTMRFLAAGAAAPPVRATGTRPAGGKTALIAVAVLLLLFAGGAIAYLAVGGGKGGKTGHKASRRTVDRAALEKANEGSEARGSGAGNTENIGRAGKAEDAEKVDVGRLIEQIDRLRKQADPVLLEAVLHKARSAREAHPEKARLAVLVKTLESEVEIARRLAELEKSLDGDPKAACDDFDDLLGQIKGNDALRDKADSLKTRACTKYTARVLAKCESAFERRRYVTAIDLCEKVRALDGSNVTAATIIERAKAKVAARRAPPIAAVPRHQRGRHPSKPGRVRVTVEPRKAPPKQAHPPKTQPGPAASADSTASMTGKQAYKAARKAALAGDKKKAVSLFRMAVSKGYKRAHGQLARLYFQLGDKANCRKHGKRYLERYPDAGDAPQIEGMLEKCK